MTYSTHLLRHLRFTIGQNIQRRRVQKKLSLQKLSRLSGVSEQLIDHYELGKSEIGLREMLRIACILEIKTEDLLVR